MYHIRYFKNIIILLSTIFFFLTIISLSYRRLSSLSELPLPTNAVSEKNKVKDRNAIWEELSKDKDIQIKNLKDEIQHMQEEIKSYKELVHKNQLSRAVSLTKENDLKIINKQKEKTTNVGKITKEELQGGEPKDSETLERRNKVKEMMKFAWDNYVKYAWGENELRPISKSGHSASIFGNSKMGVSIVDSLDTLYIMGLNKEFEDAIEWVKENLRFNLSTSVSVFELTIRFLAGLLTTYTFTKDRVILEKAVDLGNHLLDAFDNDSHLPYALIDFNSKFGHNYNWADGGCCILSEIGTLHMEFAYLSELTGNKTYVQKVNKIREILYKANKPNGLYMNFIHPKSHTWCSNFASLAGLGDSFYEYLLKEYLRSNRKDKLALKMYNSAMESMKTAGMFPTSKGGHVYVADYKRGVILEKMDHLGCFTGGMMALGAAYTNNPLLWLNMAKNVTKTCYDSYNYSSTKLGPESFNFLSNVEALGVSFNEKAYLLRPETFESYFYLWRITKDKKYREWAYEAVLALEKHAKVEHGFSGIRDVYSVPVVHDDVQQSFLLAETLKYLYLIFSDDSLIPLDRWVFNTEGHPFPIRDVVDIN